MEKNIRKYSDFEKNKENPFIKNAIEHINNRTVKKFKSSSGTTQRAVLAAVNPDTGEVLGHTSFIRQIECDEEEFIKFYLRDFRVFFGLSEKAMRVFGYILGKIKPNNDEFIFIIQDCLEQVPYKGKNSIYAALAELIKADIIAKGRSEVMFYINPMVIFNGSRVTFAKSYVKKSNKKEVEDQRQLNLFDENC